MSCSLATYDGLCKLASYVCVIRLTQKPKWVKNLNIGHDVGKDHFMIFTYRFSSVHSRLRCVILCPQYSHEKVTHTCLKRKKKKNNHRLQKALLLIKLPQDLRNGAKWNKVFKNRPSKICGRQPSKNLLGYGLLKQNISLQIF